MPHKVLASVLNPATEALELTTVIAAVRASAQASKPKMTTDRHVLKESLDKVAAGQRAIAKVRRRTRRSSCYDGLDGLVQVFVGLTMIFLGKTTSLLMDSNSAAPALN